MKVQFFTKYEICKHNQPWIGLEMEPKLEVRERSFATGCVQLVQPLALLLNC